MYRFLYDKDIAMDRWWAYTDAHPNATAFHTPFMWKAYRNVKNIEPFAIFALDQDNNILGMMCGYVQRLIPFLPQSLSSRSVLMQSPLFSNADVLGFLISNYKKCKYGKSLYTEIRAHNDELQRTHILHKHGFFYEDHLNITVNIAQKEEDLWKQVHSKRRNEIRKAKKAGLVFRMIHSHEIDAAYGILQEVYDRAHLPLLDKGFFCNSLNQTTDKCGLVIYGAFLENQMIGTMFTLQYKNTVYDYYAGSLFSHYNLNPNDLIPWEVFLHAKAQGFTDFDFGGAGKPNEPYGVRDYKKKFGGTMVNHGRYYYYANALLFRLFQTIVRLRKRRKGR